MSGESGGSCGNDAIRKIGNIGSRDAANGDHYDPVERREHEPRIGLLKRTQQPFQGGFRNLAFLGQVYRLHHADRR
jgi:hypothetical protein